MAAPIEQVASCLGERIDLAAALERARAGVAILWEYRASLGELTLRVSVSDGSDNLHFVMNGCTRIEASTSWSNAALTVEEVTPDSVEITDRPAGFLVVCGSIRSFCNVEPLFQVTP